MKQFFIIVLLTVTFWACKSGKADLSKLEGQYSRQSDEKFAKVSVQIYPKVFNEKSATFSMVRKAIIQRKNGDQLAPAEIKTENFTAVYKPETNELYVNESAITFKVDLVNKTISTPTETLTRVSDNTAP